MQYTRLQRGIGDLFGTLLNANKSYDSAVDEGYREAAQAGAYRATAHDRMADAALKQHQLAGRRSVTPDTMSALFSALQGDPRAAAAAASMAQGYASNMDDIGQFMTGHQRRGFGREAAEAARGDDANLSAMLGALARGGSPPALYSQNADGQVLGEFTGEAQQTPLSRAAAAGEGTPGVAVTVNNNEEFVGQFAKELGKRFASQYDDLEKGAVQASNQNSQLDRLGMLLDQVDTGKFAGGIQSIKQAALGMGLDLEAMGIKNDTGAAEAAQALSNQMALELRNPAGGAGMPGALSDKDREFLVSMVPGLTQTPQGRKMLIESRRRLNERSIQVAKLARDYVQQKGQLDQGFFEVLQQWSEENPLFGDLVGSEAVYEHPQLGPITEADLAATAAQRGVPVEQIIQQLGLQ